VIKVNNRKVLDGVMEAIGLGGEENAGRRLTVLRAIDKLDRLGIDGVKLLLGPGRKDESGDFTKGAGLAEAQIIELLSVVGPASRHVMREADYKGRVIDDDERTLYSAQTEVVLNDLILSEWGPTLSESAAGRQGIEELQAIADLCASAGYGTRRIRIDPSVVRGLEYYTGPVFEAELTFEVKGDDGKPVRFGSVGGGGRYDGLVARFRGEPVPATGFSIGVSRLFAALKAVKSPIVTGAAQPGPVVVLVMDKDRLGDYQKLVTTLRDAGVRAEMYLGSSGMNAQLKYADKRGSICAVIQGSNEREKGEVMIRDLVLGAQLAGGAKERADYLELRQKAQFPVAVDGLVAAVQEVLARHA
jgi:histidyl-tRNA synthetase